MANNSISIQSQGGAFKASKGGARTVVLQSNKYYYYATPTVDTVINLSDFTSWSNTPHTSGVYANGAALTDTLYDPITGASIGALTHETVCTPKLKISDVTGAGMSYLSPPSCPFPGDLASVEDSVVLASRVLQKYVEYTPPPPPPGTSYMYGQYTSLYSHEALSGGYPTLTSASGCYAMSSLSPLAETYYLGNVSGVKRLARIGNKFYRHRILIVNDVNINTWFTGKFTDASWYTGDGTQMQPTRSGTTYLDSTVTFPASYSVLISYYSCPVYNTRITLTTN